MLPVFLKVSKMSICYIISAGDCNGIDIDKKDGDLIIAADKGLEYCRKFGVAEDIVIGDFDSLGFVPEAANVITLPVAKDDTDTSYAVKYAMEKGFDKFVIYGATGGKRADHTFANIALLAYIAKKGGIGFIAADGYTITAVTDLAIRFPSYMIGDISVFSFDEKSEGVTEKGLRYSLEDAVLENSVAVGVSNSFTGQESLVSVKHGTLLIYFSGKFSDCTIDKL